jgi:hypothetical protein
MMTCELAAGPMNSTESVIPIRNNDNEGWPALWALRLLTPLKPPVRCSATGAHKGSSCKFWLHFHNFILGDASIRKTGAEIFASRPVPLRIRNGIKTHVAPITIVLLGTTHYLPLDYKPGGRVWRYRRCDFCRQPLRWPRN